MGRTVKHVRTSGKQLFVLPTLFIAAGFIYFLLTQINTYGKTDHSIEFIAEHINSRGDIVDWQNEIDVKGLEDIKLFTDNGKVTIEYGKITLNWKSMDEFLAEDNVRNLERILITIRRNRETGKIKLYWKGEEMQKWVR